MFTERLKLIWQEMKITANHVNTRTREDCRRGKRDGDPLLLIEGREFTIEAFKDNKPEESKKKKGTRQQ